MGTGKERSLAVVYAFKAREQLNEIWDWNEKRYSPEYADEYIEFLERHICAAFACSTAVALDRKSQPRRLCHKML